MPPKLRQVGVVSVTAADRKRPSDRNFYPASRVLRRMSRIAAYRSYAAECLVLAENTTHENERYSLIEMAASWHELALMLENYMEEHGGKEPPFKLEMPKRPEGRH